MQSKALLFAIIFCSIFSSCKKEISSEHTDPPVSPTITLPISKESFTSLQSLIMQGQLRNPADFTKKVLLFSEAYKANPTSKIELLDYPTGSDAPYTDVAYAATLPSIQGIQPGPTPPSVAFQYPPDMTMKSFQVTYQAGVTFTVRGNSIVLTAPFIVTVAPDPSTGDCYVLGLGKGNSVEINPTSGSWGVVTQGANQYISDYGNGVCGIHAQANEVRTKITTTSGTILIKNSIDLKIYQGGVDLGGGLTVARSENTNNLYIVNGTLQITAQGPYYSSPVPGIFASGTLEATDYGCQLNQ